MKEKDVHEELSSIRDLMERSSKFISLSGISGILAGVYALAGAGYAYTLINNHSGSEQEILWLLVSIALVVMTLSLVTGYWFSMRKARSRKENVWNPVSRSLLAAVSFPMFTGALFIGIMLFKAEYSMIAGACLLFYGLALIAGSQYTFSDIKWLGLCEILLGLLALVSPENSLLIWAIGFGLLHIVYGSVMHFKYER